MIKINNVYFNLLQITNINVYYNYILKIVSV